MSDENLTDFPAPGVDTIARAASWAKGRYGAADALVDGDVRLSFTEYVDRAFAIARGLIAAGVQYGDRVAVWAPNAASTAVAILGVHCSGAVLVPINTRFKAREAAQILQDSAAKVLFTVDDFLGVHYAASLHDHASSAESTLDSLPKLVILDQDGADSVDQLIVDGSSIADADFEAAVARIGPDSIGTMLFTSGTTGKPKGAMLRHGALVRAYWTWSSIAGYREGDRFLCSNPFFHAFGLKVGLLSCLIQGVALYPMAVFDAGRAMEIIERERITYYPGPPTVFQSMLAHPDFARRDLSSLRGTVTGATSIPSQLIHDLYDRLGFEEVHIPYGFTEATGIATLTRASDSRETVTTTAGSALPGVTVAILRNDGSIAGLGEVGEVGISGYCVMPGYFDPETGECVPADENGWLRVGDLGELDAQGNLIIRGRTRDMLIVGGFNAYPAEIEGYLVEHPDVVGAAVIGRVDERLGEVPHAFVILRGGSGLTEVGLITWARDRMANYKVPRGVTFVEALPLNATGKVVKEDLRRMLAPQV